MITLIQAELNKLNWDKQPQSLYNPIAYTLSSGGKRLRPMLTLLACEMFTNDIQPAIAPALGLEVFHNFTLLHDDIMDRAQVRRGQPTVHTKWNDNTAILSGDVMQIEAYRLLTQAPAYCLKPVLDLFLETANAVCEGQQYDMEFENREDVHESEYLTMIRLKTAVLLACSLKTGALIGGASPHDADALYQVGVNLGLAFQLKDDLLDVYGNEADFGKKIGGDIVCNKKTYLLIQAFKLASGQDAKRLQEYLQKEYANIDNKIKDVTRVYDVLGVKGKCEEKMEAYYQMAIANLNEVSVLEDKKRILRNLAQKLMYRNE